MPLSLALLSVLCLARPAADQIVSGAVTTSRVATGQRLHPAGESLAFHGRPTDLVLSPNGKSLYLKDNRGLVLVDMSAWRIRQELPFASGGGSMHGIVVTRDGRRVYATTAQNVLAEAEADANGRLRWRRQIALPGPKREKDSHPCGLALSPDERHAYVCLSRNNSLGVVDLETGRLESEIAVGVAPWGIALSPDGGTAYVTDWGGSRPRSGALTALSSGTPTSVDARGVANSGAVSMVNLQQGREVAQVATGLHPSGIALRRDGSLLYVANANSDTVSVIATASEPRLIATLSTRPDARLPFGSAPNALALSEDETTLYVANGGNNAVAVIALNRKTEGRTEARGESGNGGRNVEGVPTGFIPTGWYPGALVCRDNTLYVANVKGLGSRWNKSEPGEMEGAETGAAAAKVGGKHKTNAKRSRKTGWSVYDTLGTVNRVALPDADRLRAYTAQVQREARLPDELRRQERARQGVRAVPVPTRVGEPSVFQHVVYILKENRTYDQMFGDLPQGDGNPHLTLYGRHITPNHHALAEQFVLLDNFYCNGVLSADGHSWATEGNVTDHLEKAFGGFTRSYTFGDDPLTYSSSGFLWDNALAHGLSFRNYGEMDYTNESPDVNYATIYKDFLDKSGKITFTHSIGIDNLRRFSCPDAPGWNMDIPDVMRADVFIRDLRQFAQTGDFPNLTLLYLPNDHTTGTTPGDPTPNAYLADNDLALGRVVEAISHSPFWPTTVIFVVEDDPQDGFDHVDGHRSPCLVISPYTRRGTVNHAFYNQTSVLHTMERILGLPPMNQMDGAAPLMRACFVGAGQRPDLRPYACLPNEIPLGQTNPKPTARNTPTDYWARQSALLTFARPDQASEDTLNRILWFAAKGSRTPYPAAYTGAHGRGLKARHLRLAE